MIHDVVICGAGPVGLMLACELRLAGVQPLVLEKLEAPTGLSKALGIQGRGVDLLELRGLLDRFAALASDGTAFAHFGMIPLDVSRLPGNPTRALFIQQARTEALLEERARELNVDIRRGHEVVGLTQDADGVDVEVDSTEGRASLRARYVVGCDGGHSRVRELAQIAFPGLAGTSLLRIGDVQLGPEESNVRQGHAPAPRLAVPLGDGFFRVTTREPIPADFDRSVPMTLAELHESVLRTTGVDLPMRSPRWLSRFTDASRQAEHYRVGRVLVAGDAAHVHLPAGGPGLSTGFNDAGNLGWKLAGAIRGWAPTTLLDTYHSERHPAGERVLLHTRAQTVLLGGGERVKALRTILGELFARPDAMMFIAELLQGTDTHYDMGESESHPLVGKWLPAMSITTAQGTARLTTLMHTARGVLVARPACAEVVVIARGWSDRVDIAIGELGPEVDNLEPKWLRDMHDCSKPIGANDRPLASNA